MSRRFSMRALATILSGLAFLAVVAATVYLLTAPLYQHVTTAITENGEETVQSTATLVEVNGTWVVFALIGVTLVSGLPLLAALRRSASQRLVTWACTLLLLAYSIAGSFTIGLFFMPGAVLLLLAAIATLFIRAASPARS
jgi:hypothetical protein